MMLPNKISRLVAKSPKSHGVVLLVALLVTSSFLPNIHGQLTSEQQTHIDIALDKASYTAGERLVTTLRIFTSVDEEKAQSEPIVISLISPAGPYESVRIVPKDIKANTAYSISHTFNLRSDAHAGTWSATASYMDARASVAFSVKSPEVATWVKIASEKELYRIGDVAKFTVSVQPVTDQPVTITITGPDRNTYLQERFLTDRHGNAQVSFDIRRGYPEGRWLIGANYHGSSSQLTFFIESTATVKPIPSISLVTSTQSITWGSEISMEIRVGNDGVSPIILQYSIDRVGWRTITEVVPRENHARVSWTPNVEGRIHLRAYFEGNDVYERAASNIVMIEVKARDDAIQKILPIFIDLSEREMNLGERVSIRVNVGTVTKTVLLQYSVDRVNWRNIVDVSTPGTVAWNPDSVGEFYIRAYFAGDGEYGESVSNVARVNVKERSTAQTVDVFTQLGGKGTNMDGGVFVQGDRLMIFMLVTEVRESVVLLTVDPLTTTENVRPIAYRLEVDRRGLASIALDTKTLPPNTYVATARIEGTNVLDSVQFRIVRAQDVIQPDDTIRLNLMVSTRNVNLGDSVAVSVRTNPPVTGHVVIQVSGDRREWQDILRVSLSEGMGRASWTPDATGMVYVRANYADRHTSSYSEPIALNVKIETMSIRLEKRTFLPGQDVGLAVSYIPNAELRLLVLDADGNAIVDRNIRTDANGHATFHFSLNVDAVTGTYIVTITDVTNGSENSVRFMVDRPRQKPHLERPFVSGELLIGLREDVRAEAVEIRRIIAEVGGEIVNVIEEINAVKIRLPIGLEEEARVALQRSEAVRFSSTNKYLVPASMLLLPEALPEQMESYELMNIPTLWPITNDSTIVAVLDSGIDMEHPALKESVWLNDECDDADDDCHGWNFFHDNNNVMDEGGTFPMCDSHGTHVAGIINAIGNAWRSSVVKGVTIMPVKVSGNTDVEGKTMCVSTEERVSQGVIYAVNNGARIINISLGCPNQDKCEMPALGDAFRYAHNRGALVVVPSGNENGMNDWQDYADYVVEVAAADTSGELAWYSNTGPGVTFVAPGTHVYSTMINGYDVKTGTSQAAAMVSGCASVLLSTNGFLMNDGIEEILGRSANDIGIGRDAVGHGLVDCSSALNEIVSLNYENASMKLFLLNSPEYNTSIQLVLPRALIDSRTGEGLSGGSAEFLVFVDDRLIVHQENISTPSERVLTISLPSGVQYVEVIGTYVTPEFGVIAAFVLAITVAFGTVFTRKRINYMFA